MRLKNPRSLVADPSGLPVDRGIPRDLPPWADPYIACLLAKHRLQAALDDSLSFLRADIRQDSTDLGLPNRFQQSTDHRDN